MTDGGAGEAALAAAWGLAVGESLTGGNTGAMVRAVARVDGSAAVLKIPVIDDENRREPDALRRYDGDGAVRLLEHDPATGAMLLERLVPGTPLSDLADRDAAIGVVCALLRRLRRPVAPRDPFPRMTELLEAWRRAVRHDPPAAEAAAWLAATGQDRLLVNRDGHLGNVLAAAREPWLLIDPKPVAGEAAFEGGHLVLDLLPDEPTLPDAAATVARVAAGLGVAPERVAAHALVRAAENAVWAQSRGDDPGPDLARADVLRGHW